MNNLESTLKEIEREKLYNQFDLDIPELETDSIQESDNELLNIQFEVLTNPYNNVSTL